jgi:hypothetical protein
MHVVWCGRAASIHFNIPAISYKHEHEPAAVHVNPGIFLTSELRQNCCCCLPLLLPHVLPQPQAMLLLRRLLHQMHRTSRLVTLCTQQRRLQCLV